jgi:N4-gp56 family major capsid protein
MSGTVQTTINLSNSVRTQYLSDYMKGAMGARVYDQLASPIGKNMEELQHGSAVQVNFLSDMQVREQTISETADITAQALRDATATITPTSRADALRYSELLDIQNYLGYASEAVKKVGENAMLTIDWLALVEALTGTHVYRNAARASLDAGTSGDRLSEAKLSLIETRLMSLKVPSFVSADGVNMWAAIMHPAVYYDLRTGGNVIEAAKYQRAEIIFKHELAQIGHFKLIVTPWAKVFGAAGADNGTNVATTLNGNANALATTIVTAGDVSASIAAGEMWTIGTEETGNTFYPTNERVKVVSASGTTLTIVGEGPNGGLKYDHLSGEAVRNADSVYPVAFGSPSSMAKIYATSVGEFGKILDPKRVGTAEQWVELAWKFYGGYGTWSEAHIMRGEFSSSLEA